MIETNETGVSTGISINYNPDPLLSLKQKYSPLACLKDLEILETEANQHLARMEFYQRLTTHGVCDDDMRKSFVTCKNSSSDSISYHELLSRLSSPPDTIHKIDRLRLFSLAEKISIKPMTISVAQKQKPNQEDGTDNEDKSPEQLTQVSTKKVHLTIPDSAVIQKKPLYDGIAKILSEHSGIVSVTAKECTKLSSRFHINIHVSEEKAEEVTQEIISVSKRR